MHARPASGPSSAPRRRARRLAGTLAAAAAFAATPAAAQFTPVGPAVGETYHVEILGGFWNPVPTAIVSSEQLGIPGTDIDFVNDLGVARKQFRDLRIVLRPARKHKFRLQYTPVRYTAEALVTKDIVFNAIRYRVGLPVSSDLSWTVWRFGYEYDVYAGPRGFAGLILEAKYTTVSVTLESPNIGTEFARARAPIPAVGGIGRVYVIPNVAATFELTGFKLPNIDEKYRATYVDWDLYGTVNFSEHFGAQIGYRSLNANYQIELDTGDLKLTGPYFAGIVRF